MILRFSYLDLIWYFGKKFSEIELIFPVWCDKKIISKQLMYIRILLFLQLNWQILFYATFTCQKIFIKEATILNSLIYILQWFFQSSSMNGKHFYHILKSFQKHHVRIQMPVTIFFVFICLPAGIYWLSICLRGVETFLYLLASRYSACLNFDSQWQSFFDVRINFKIAFVWLLWNLAPFLPNISL